MTIPRVIVKDELSDGKLIELSGEHFHYLCRVVRLKVGDKFYLLDNNSRDYIGEVINIDKNKLFAYVYQIREMAPPDYKIKVIFSLLKGDKNDFIIKTGTTLGITDFIPIISKRTIVNINDTKENTKVMRLKKIAEETARTSFLPFIPQVTKIRKFSEIDFDEPGLKLLFSEKKGLPLLKSLEADIANSKTIITFFGPEGGIEESEFGFLKERGFLPVSLGDRALKAEFAFVFALSVIIYIMRGRF